ncbi:MAG: hypothetical protein N4A47_01890 [Clostridia bacterium]|jgi:hypothetical protein|nr:hypothetical protein [Clostridia bacterium]
MRESIKREIKSFVIDKIFRGYDDLVDNRYYEEHIVDTSKFVFEGEEYIGYEGFSRWFDNVKSLVKPTMVHNISNFDIRFIAENKYKVDFEVEFKAELNDGTKVHDFVRESWVLNHIDDTFVFESYLTEKIR